MNEQILAVQRMQDYIEAHLYGTITPADLAKISLYSPWYARRLFGQLTGLTPADYIRRLRLSRSALKLRDEACKIADIAFELGFGSVDGYQRAFFREFGYNPGDYAANPVPLYLFTPYGVKYRDIGKEKRMNTDMKNEMTASSNGTSESTVKCVFIQVIQKPERKVILKRGVTATDYFTYCGEVGCDVWGLLTSMKSLCGEPVCLWLPKSLIRPGTSEYVQGVEVSSDYDGVIPDGFEMILLPAASYLMFQGEPFEEEDYCQAIDQVQQAIDRYEPSVIGYTWDKTNPRVQLEPIGTRGYIELLPIKAVCFS